MTDTSIKNNLNQLMGYLMPTLIKYNPTDDEFVDLLGKIKRFLAILVNTDNRENNTIFIIAAKNLFKHFEISNKENFKTQTLQLVSEIRKNPRKYDELKGLCTANAQEYIAGLYSEEKSASHSTSFKHQSSSQKTEGAHQASSTENPYSYYQSPNKLSPHEQFMLAVERGDIINARKLLDEGVDINQTGFSREFLRANSKELGNYTALQLAINRKNPVMVEFLLENGALRNDNEDLPQELSSALHVLITSLRQPKAPLTDAERSIVDILLKYVPIDILLERKDARTPLQEACNWGAYYMAEMLINQGANLFKVDHKGLTAFDYASRRGNIEIMKLLLNQLPEKDKQLAKDYMLAVTVHENKLEAAQWLINNGTAVATINNEGRTLLHTAVASDSIRFFRDRVAMVKLVLNAANKQGISLVDVQDNNGHTAMHLAIIKGDNRWPIISHLLSEKADIGLRDNQGRVFSDYATGNIKKSIAVELRKHFQQTPHVSTEIPKQSPHHFFSAKSGEGKKSEVSDKKAEDSDNIVLPKNHPNPSRQP